MFWNRGGEPYDYASVQVEADSVVLFRYQTTGRPDREQRIPIVWTSCRYGGRRPWLTCESYSKGEYCGQRAAILYGVGDMFACRSCYGLSYQSQHESPRLRRISRSRKIRVGLGGSEDLFQPFPTKPRGMHHRTYERLRARGVAADGDAFSRAGSGVESLLSRWRAAHTSR